MEGKIPSLTLYLEISDDSTGAVYFEAEQKVDKTLSLRDFIDKVIPGFQEKIDLFIKKEV